MVLYNLTSLALFGLLSSSMALPTINRNDEGPLSEYCLGRRGQFRYPPDCHQFVNCGDGGTRAFLQTWGAIQYTYWIQQYNITKILKKVRFPKELCKNYRFLQFSRFFYVNFLTGSLWCFSGGFFWGFSWCFKVYWIAPQLPSLPRLRPHDHHLQPEVRHPFSKAWR